MSEPIRNYRAYRGKLIQEVAKHAGKRWAEAYPLGFHECTKQCWLDRNGKCPARKAANLAGIRTAEAEIWNWVLGGGDRQLRSLLLADPPKKKQARMLLHDVAGRRGFGRSGVAYRSESPGYLIPEVGLDGLRPAEDAVPLHGQNAMEEAADLIRRGREADRARQLREGIRRLEDLAAQRALTMRELEGWTRRATAEELGLSERSVSRKVQWAKSGLAEDLAHLRNGRS